MALEAIIIRADGALANTEDIRRRAFSQVFSEAGLEWTCGREGFALTAKLGQAEARMAHYVRAILKDRRETEDFSLLIQAMHRRSLKAFAELVERDEISPRPGARDLLVAARAEGLKVVAVSRMRRNEVDALLKSIFGTRGVQIVDVVVAMNEGASIEDLATLYQEARQAVGGDPKTALVVEGSKSGATAARDAGFAVLTTRVGFSSDALSFDDGFLVVEELSSLLPGRERMAHNALSADDRSDLIAAMRRLHVTNCQSLAALEWSNYMRVADILKAKGSAVKTIDPTATMLALAQGLKVEGVGAMLVQDVSGHVHGIISERDLARGLDQYGNDLTRIRVSDLMTRSVVTCAPDDSVSTVANVMTQRRIRHLPVVSDGKLVGLVSIGDVLKHRLEEVELEANVLRDVARLRR